jgi:hypothetical protein
MQTVKKQYDVEKEAWESILVGSWDDVLELSKSYPKTASIQHLAFFSIWEQGEVLPKKPESLSLFSPMAEALHLYNLKKYKDAELLFLLYWNDNKKPICYSFLKLGIKISLENNNFEMGFKIIERFKSVFQSNPFLREELSILFHLKKYKEVVQLFRKNTKVFSSESDIRYFGLSLYFLGLFKESEEILSKSQLSLKLPSFEEKKNEFLEIFGKSSELESRWSDLSFEEKQDVGFAYLFHSNYKKAEEIFTSLVAGK